MKLNLYDLDELAFSFKEILARQFKSRALNRILNLADNEFGFKKGRQIRELLALIPLGFIELNLSRNALYFFLKTPGVKGCSLALIFTAIPIETIRVLNLSGNQLSLLPIDQLVNAFTRIPQITHLKLRENSLHLFGATKLVSLLQALPSVIHLDLSSNNLGTLKKADLKLVFAAFLPNIRTINLSNNFLRCKNDAEWMELINALPLTIKEVIWDENSYKRISAITEKLRVLMFKEHALIPPLTAMIFQYTLFNLKQTIQVDKAVVKEISGEKEIRLM